jgi:hypothetical protein
MGGACRFAHRLCEDFANQLFALLPESLCVLSVERITAHTLADGANLRLRGDEFGDLAILTILASDFISMCNHSRPDRRRGSLRNRLELERRLACCYTQPVAESAKRAVNSYENLVFGARPKLKLVK